MNNLLLSHKRFLVSWIINFGLILVIIFLAGCASRRLVPLPDGGLINPELQRATKTEKGVTVTVQASAWDGEASDLGRSVISLFIILWFCIYRKRVFLFLPILFLSVLPLVGLSSLLPSALG